MTTGDAQDVDGIRRHYQAMLDGNAGEPAFQRFFATHPVVLALGLPRRVDERCIRTHGRPGKSEADFVFVRESAERTEFGVIELKRPGMHILKSPRKLVVTLTNDAATAVAQAREYAARLQDELGRSRKPAQALDRFPRMYVVMGRSDDRMRDLLSGLEERQVRAVFPDDVRIVTYDQILSRFVERFLVQTLNKTADPPSAAQDYVMLPQSHGSDLTHKSFALSAPPSLVEALRRARIREVSVYSRSVAAASAAECRGEVDPGSETGLVYLLVLKEGLFVLTTLRDRVIEVERAEHRDERDALKSAGALNHLLHISMDPSADPWLVKAAGELPPTGI